MRPEVATAVLMPPLPADEKNISATAEVVTTSQLAEEVPDAPLSLQDIKQAKTRRKHQKAVQQGRPLTIELVARRNLGTSPGGSRLIGSLQYVELDRERINDIPVEVLPTLSRVTRLYLQHNSLQDMLCFASLARLRYLTVSHNYITEVRGIRNLPTLMALDISHNHIVRLAVEELPQSLQFIQLHDNPLNQDEDAVFSALAAGLPKLRQVDGRDVPASRLYSDSFVAVTTANSSGDKFTNEMIEAALQEMERNDTADGDGSVDVRKGGRPPVQTRSSAPLEHPSLSLSRQSSKGDIPSPVRVTPAASRQTSAELGSSPAEIRDMLARVREALPTVREAPDIGLGIELSTGTRSHSAQGLVAYHRRTSVDQLVRSKVRSTSLPVRPDLTQIPPPPGVTGHWSFSEPLSPQRVTSALSAALSTLTGSAPPTRSLDAVNMWAHTQKQRQQVLGALFAKRPNSAQAPYAAAGARGARLTTLSEEAPVLPGDPSSTVAGTDSKLQQSPFEASATSQDGSPTSESAGSRRSSGAMASPFEPASAFVPDEPLERLTVGEMSRQHHAYQARQEAPRRTSLHRRASSTINEDLLQGLLQRDAPRVEVLSEALQRGSVSCAADQLAALSEDPKERMVAEHARMSLRRGIAKMLADAQHRREKHAESDAALLEELASLKTVKALHGHLSSREGHASPQPHVLANIISSHSRLGSITDRLGHVFEAAIAPELHSQQAAEQKDASAPQKLAGEPLTQPNLQSVVGSPTARMASPFESSAEASEHADGGRHALPDSPRVTSPFESSTFAASGGTQQDGQRQFLVQGMARGSSSSSSSSSGSEALSRRSQPVPAKPAARSMQKITDAKQATIPEESARASPLQSKMSVRRRNSGLLAPSLSSDSDNSVPRSRQAARMEFGGIEFGGIAKLVKGPSGQLEPPPSPVPTTARQGPARLAPQMQDGAPLQRQGVARRPLPPPAPHRSSGSGGGSATSSETEPNKAPVSSTESDSDWRPPHPRHPGGREMNRSSSSRTHAADKRTMDLRTAAELTAARDATYQNELWVRFSGGADRQARTLTTSAFGGQAGGETSPLQFRSPFSAASNTPVSSPFSTASAGATLTQDDHSDDRLGLEAAGGRGKTWSQGDLRGMQQMQSPFARSRLPSMVSSSQEEDPPVQAHAQRSAPPIPATAILQRVEEAVDLNRDAPEASSAPPHIALRQALLSSLSEKQRMVLKSRALPPPALGPLPARAVAEQVGDVLSAGESSAHLGSHDGGNYLQEGVVPTTAVLDGPAAEEKESSRREGRT